MNASEAMTEAVNFSDLSIPATVYVYSSNGQRMEGRIVGASSKTITVSYRRWDKVHTAKFNRATASEWGTGGEWGLHVKRADIIDSYRAAC